MFRDETGTYWTDEGQKIHPNDVKAYRRAARRAVATERRRTAAAGSTPSPWAARTPTTNVSTRKQPGRRYGPAPRPRDPALAPGYAAGLVKP